MIVDHSYRLHEGVADCAPYEVETSLLQIFAHSIGFGRAGRNSLSGFPAIYFWFSANELPDVFVEGTEFFLHCEEGFGVSDGRSDF